MCTSQGCHSRAAGPAHPVRVRYAPGVGPMQVSVFTPVHGMPLTWGMESFVPAVAGSIWLACNRLDGGEWGFCWAVPGSTHAPLVW